LSKVGLRRDVLDEVGAGRPTRAVGIM
jgi:hypothetical protein